MSVEVLTANEIKQAFMDVAPLYCAERSIARWVEAHGFQYGFSLSRGVWVVHEYSEGRMGLDWGEPFTDYATMLTAILDEIVARTAR